MVKSRRSARTVVLAVAALAASASVFTGCGLRKLWGEAPLKPGVIEMADTGAACPELSWVVRGTEEESLRAFDCWAAQLDDLWTKIAGRQKDTLTDHEIRTLITKGIVKMAGEPADNVQKVLSLKTLLGIEGPLTREKLNDWVKLLRTERARARVLYQKFTDKAGVLRYRDLQDAAKVASVVLRQMNWSLDSDELTGMALVVLDVRDPQIREAFLPAMQVGINLLNSVCPTFSIKDKWNTREFASCLLSMSERFQTGAAWFEFLMNPSMDITPADQRAIRVALETLGLQLDSWFPNRSLTSISVARWLELSGRLGSPAPDGFIGTLDRFMKKFNKDSSGKFIHPTAFIGIFDLIRNFQLGVLEGVPYFQEAVAQRRCQDPSITYWADCVPEDLAALREKSEKIDFALRVRNIRHGRTASPFSGANFGRLMLFDSVALKVLDAFGSVPKGRKFKVISAKENKNDEVVQLLTVGLQGYETMRGFADNMFRKARGEPFENYDSLKSIRSRPLHALAQLITMTHDVLVERTPEQRSDFEAGIKAIIDIAPQSGYYLDHMAVTAIITLADGMTDYRAQYMKLLEDAVEDGPARGMVHRAVVIERLRELMRINFPRTVASCDAYGWSYSCGLAIDEILPNPAPEQRKGGDLIYAADLDILTITGAAVEGLIDGCDIDGNEVLNWGTRKGQKELDCGYTAMKDIVKRLIDAEIIEADSVQRTLAKFALEAINFNFLTRDYGKAAMVRGSHHWYHTLFARFYKGATIGSLYGMASNLIDQKAVKKLRKEHKRRQKEAAEAAQARGAQPAAALPTEPAVVGFAHFDEEEADEASAPSEQAEDPSRDSSGSLHQDAPLNEELERALLSP